MRREGEGKLSASRKKDRFNERNREGRQLKRAVPLEDRAKAQRREKGRLTERRFRRRRKRREDFDCRSLFSYPHEQLVNRRQVTGSLLRKQKRNFPEEVWKTKREKRKHSRNKKKRNTSAKFSGSRTREGRRSKFHDVPWPERRNDSAAGSESASTTREGGGK